MSLFDVEGLVYYQLPDTLEGWATFDPHDNSQLWLSAIYSKEEGKGYLREFLDEVEQKYIIIVPNPSKRMRKILQKRGYIESTKETEFGLCNVMIKLSKRVYK